MVSVKQNKAITAAHQILGPGVMGPSRYQQHHATITSPSRVHKGKEETWVYLYHWAYKYTHLKGNPLTLHILNQGLEYLTHNSKHEIHHQKHFLSTQWKLSIYTFNGHSPTVYLFTNFTFPHEKQISKEINQR
jgi:hypothetical protein